ncbi:MAG: endonuclease [Cyclobacteriaceae bacterium]
MFKIFSFFFAILISASSLAQIPTSYYSSATGTGYSLKTQLHDIIDDHNNQGYTALWNFYSNYELDAYYESDGTILDIYSENPSGTDPYNFTKEDDQCGNYSGEGSCYNREHSFPKSWFSDGQPMYADVHHIFASDGYVNGQRSNLPYGEVGTSVDFESENGSKKGSARNGLGYTGTVFEPIDEFKGDLARAYFYMATRYEDVLAGWSSAMLDGSTDQVYEEWALDMLINWHQNDPVSQKEIDRNNNAYTFQGNRNPFIDHPEWVNTIWGDGSAFPSITTSVSDLDFGFVAGGSSSLSSSYTVTGSNLEGTITIAVSTPFELSTNNSTWGQEVMVSQSNAEAGSSNTIYVRFSPEPGSNDTYTTVISHNSTNATPSTIEVSGTSNDETPTSSGSGGAVFFSEYLEGSGNNKAIEIYNGTNETIDLETEGYYIERYNNGATTPSGTQDLTGNLTAGDVYVIGNPSADQAILNESDITSEITFFNGDDAIALYKNEELIDLIGIIGYDPGSSWSSGSHSTGEKTLIRKESIRKGNTSGFDPISTLEAEWDVYDQNFSNDLGSHTFSPTSMTFTWTGNNNSNWDNPANWDQNLIPLNIDNIVVNATTNLPVIEGDIGTENITINSEGKITILSGGSLAILGTMTCLGTVEVRRNVTGNLGYSILSSPVTTALISDLSAAFIYDYDGAAYTLASGNMTPGSGYFASFSQENPSIVFEGIPNSGTISSDIYIAGDNFNLIGNPYTAAIDRASFVAANSSAIDGNIWIWDDGGENFGSKRGGDFIVINDMGSTSLVRLNDEIDGNKGTVSFNGKLGSMQGFLVKAVTNTAVSFTPDMQDTNTGSNADEHYYRDEVLNIQKLRLSLFGNDLYNDLLIGFSENATLKKDYALDAEKITNNDSISLYSIQGEYKYAIQALPLLENAISVNLGFTIKVAGLYKLEIAQTDQLDSNVSIELNDNLLKKTIDLGQVKSYSFHSNATTNSDRFSLTFSENRALNNNLNGQIEIYPGISETIINGLPEGTTHLQIHTLDGREVFNRSIYSVGVASIKPSLDKNTLYIIRVGNEQLKFFIH